MGASQLLLADEPTGNLDSKTSLTVAELLQQLNSDGQAIVLVTHDQEIAAYTTRTLMMRDVQFVQILGQDINCLPNQSLKISKHLRFAVDLTKSSFCHLVAQIEGLFHNETSCVGCQIRPWKTIISSACMISRVFLILAISIFSCMLGSVIVVPLLPLYAESLGASWLWLGVIFAAYPISRILPTPVFGRLSDRKGVYRQR
ncbi:hypothetical protein ACFLVS_02930 [Chloroflexota bacterium]